MYNGADRYTFGGMSKLIAFRMSDALREQFEARCAADGLNATAAITLAIVAWLEPAGTPVAPDKPVKAKAAPKTIPIARRGRVRGYDAKTGEPFYD